ncbi:MAG TPA: DNA repair protein RecN [Oscillatoriaceae cyanobacterium M33_DOE_052]|uniref:DNA repair protein RecN n=1 Tax=Planktothricoides sp. SpSt-374 TaxID=2282167 RepID=A0A7C3VFD4_9CYAN|nr:DNA repair protein RecN [Oscillatoriaceae cyanobacterium M33_DOE_052]
MLVLLRIENFALIDRLELEFGSGLNVLTGETGAGKSIILDALDAVLGGKVTLRAVRSGTERALIEATFECGFEMASWVRQQEIELLDGNLLVVSREMVASRSGGMRSRSRLNGILVNRQMMDQLRDRLVEITAQGQTVQLGQPARQREWLDAFGGPRLAQQRQIVARIYAECTRWLQAVENRRQSEQQRLQRLDLLQYQLQELTQAGLADPEELQYLEAERQRLSHVVELQQQSYQAYQLLYQNDSDGPAAADLLGQVESVLSDMVQYDGQLQPVLEMVKDALAQASEAGLRLSSYSGSLETDPERLEEVEERIVQLKQICRKYGPTLKEAIAYSERVETELEALTNPGESLESLEQKYFACKQQLDAACSQLTQMRHSAAAALESRLVEELRPLAMDKVQFQVQITPTEANSTGADQIVFLFSANPGEQVQPLSQTASGGEMSRFLLALKACFSQRGRGEASRGEVVGLTPELESECFAPTGTLVFDEIDVGVSGKVAAAIAEKLYQLSQHQQVLFVTHQPMVAAIADHHFRVAKQVIDTIIPPSNGVTAPDSPDSQERTVVRVASLVNSQRREELAQMAGGNSEGEAIAWAESLLAQAAQMRRISKIADSTDDPTKI